MLIYILACYMNTFLSLCYCGSVNVLSIFFSYNKVNLLAHLILQVDDQDLIANVDGFYLEDMLDMFSTGRKTSRKTSQAMAGDYLNIYYYLIILALLSIFLFLL